ncbi:hypothetical protein [Flavobacterium sp. LB1P62]|uniref:hypothetical protein n=1 Tax=Flavobacterium sp. LB1P62 TaxID=3401715 RepID=UPI003AAE30E3
MSLPLEQKKINEDTFTNLNEESAFLLGYIFTDGFLGFHKNTGLNYLRIYSKDKVKIENIKLIFQSEAKVNHIKEKYYGEVKQGELFYLHVGNEIVIEDLIDLGMVEKKNDKIKFPYLPTELYSHFIRGVWSGKGYVSTYKNSIFSTFSFGSIDFITDLEKHLRSKGLSKRKIELNKFSKKPSYKIKYSVTDTKKLYDYIYNCSTDLTTCIEQENLLKEYFADYKPPKRKMKRRRNTI